MRIHKRTDWVIRHERRPAEKDEQEIAEDTKILGTMLFFQGKIRGKCLLFKLNFEFVWRIVQEKN